MTRNLRGAVIAGICVLALGACSATRQVGEWTEDATSWTKGQITPASANAGPVAYNTVGVASWYGKNFHGRTTASGEKFDMNGMTAAHRTLPFGTKVRVTNLSNGRSVVLTINDRGPKLKSREIDVSRRAAGQLGFRRKGKARVRIETIGPQG